MLRIILGIIVGFLVWSILWIGTDQILINISPDWYGAHQGGFGNAMFNKTAFSPDSTILLMHLVRAVVITLVAGYLAAFIAGENKRSTIGLGILLLIFGVGVQAMAWNYIPLWYHIIFLALLVPMTIAGGKLRTRLV